MSGFPTLAHRRRALVGLVPGCWRVCCARRVASWLLALPCARRVVAWLLALLVRSSGRLPGCWRCCALVGLSPAAGAWVRFSAGCASRCLGFRASHSQGSFPLRWCGWLCALAGDFRNSHCAGAFVGTARVVLGVLAGFRPCAGTPALCAGVRCARCALSPTRNVARPQKEHHHHHLMVQP